MPETSNIRVILRLFGKNTPLNPYVFKTFKEEDIRNWGVQRQRLTRMDFVVNHSCVPYGSIMWSQEYLDILFGSLNPARNLSRTEEMRLTRASGLNFYRYRFLRYCPLCALNDMEEYGEPYWHRLHQLPGIMICPVHEVETENSRYSLHYINHRFVPAAYALTLDKMRFLSPKRPASLCGNYISLANDSAWLLENGLTLRSVLQEVIQNRSTMRADPLPVLPTKNEIDETFLYDLLVQMESLSERGSLQKDGIFKSKLFLIHLIQIESEFGSMENFYHTLV